MVLMLKLITGEDVISEVTEDGDNYILKTPMSIGMTQEGAAVMPLCAFSEDNIIISKKNVLFTATPDQDYKNHYNTNFGNGIVTATDAPSGGIVGLDGKSVK